MTGHEKELSEIKGYVARLYQMIRHRTQISVELTEEQNETAEAVGDTIEDINTKLQIANSFQQNEIFEELKVIAKTIKQLLGVSDPSLVEDEKFTKVDNWMNLKIETSFGGPMAVFYGDLMGYVISESDNSINVKEIYSVISYQGQNWRKTGFEPFAKMVDQNQEINIDKKSLLYIVEPSKEKLEIFTTYRKKHSEHEDIKNPWAF